LKSEAKTNVIQNVTLLTPQRFNDFIPMTRFPNHVYETEAHYWNVMMELTNSMNELFFWKLRVTQLVKKLPTSMGPGVSLPFSQKSTSRPHPGQLNPIYFFPFLKLCQRSVHLRQFVPNCFFFFTAGICSVSCPFLRLEYHLLSALGDCLFIIFELRSMFGDRLLHPPRAVPWGQGTHPEIVTERKWHLKKVKLSLCFNWAPRHEGVLGSGDIAPVFLWPRH
jgi:hypothetical protein